MARKSVSALVIQAENDSLRAQVHQLTKELGESRAQVAVLTTQASRLDANYAQWQNLRSASLQAKTIILDACARLAMAVEQIERRG